MEKGKLCSKYSCEAKHKVTLRVLVLNFHSWGRERLHKQKRLKRPLAAKAASAASQEPPNAYHNVQFLTRFLGIQREHSSLCFLFRITTQSIPQVSCPAISSVTHTGHHSLQLFTACQSFYFYFVRVYGFISDIGGLPRADWLLTEWSEKQQIGPPACPDRAPTPDNYEVALCSSSAIAEPSDVTHRVAATNWKGALENWALWVLSMPWNCKSSDSAFRSSGEKWYSILNDDLSFKN